MRGHRRQRFHFLSFHGALQLLDATTIQLTPDTQHATITRTSTCANSSEFGTEEFRALDNALFGLDSLLILSVIHAVTNHPAADLRRHTVRCTSPFERVDRENRVDRESETATQPADTAAAAAGSSTFSASRGLQRAPRSWVEQPLVLLLIPWVQAASVHLLHR